MQVCVPGVCYVGTGSVWFKGEEALVKRVTLFVRVRVDNGKAERSKS